MKNILITLLCLLAYKVAFAQKIGKIKGKIADESAIAMPYAMVKLTSTTDSSVTEKVQTNLDGQFSFEVTSGDYFLYVTAMGYQSYSSAKLTVIDSLILPTIKLASLRQQLKQVTIEGKKSFIEHRIDKTILNVENSIVSTGGTALEVLEKAPGVVIDRQNDKILLNNKGVAVMIDGKSNILSGADLSTYLNGLSSSQIATIEIIENPSAKYDAAGNGGIINIKLKRNKTVGTNGSVSANYRNALVKELPTNIYGSEINLNLNRRTEKWNFFTNINASKNNNFSVQTLTRTTSLNGLQSTFNQKFDKLYNGSRLAGKLGADYFVSDKTTVGIMLDANSSTRTLDNNSQTVINEVLNNAYSKRSIIQISDVNTPNKNYTLNLNLKHNLKKEGSSLSFDADYSAFDYKGVEQFDAAFYQENMQLDSNTLLRNHSKTNIDIYALKGDLTLPISKVLKLDAGLKSSYVKTNNDFLATRYLSNNWQNIAGQSNLFLYQENINAGYVNMLQDWGKWQLQAGLRAEYTHSKGTSVTNASVAKNNYLSLFPTVFVLQKINDNHQVKYSYGRRIDRPNYQQLNPFNFYLDPYTIAIGNPYLKPQFTNNFSVAYNYKNGASISLTYTKTTDLILDSKTAQNDTTRVVTVGQGNIGSGQYYSTNLYFPLQIAKGWGLQSNFNIFFNKFNDNDIAGAVFQLQKVAYNFSINSNVTLPRNWTMETSFWLNSPRVRGLERTTIYQYALNMGVQKSVLEKKLRFRVSVDDIFATNYWKGSLQYQNVNLRVQNNYISRRIVFGINYNFGNQNIKLNNDRKTATDDIKNRAGK